MRLSGLESLDAEACTWGSYTLMFGRDPFLVTWGLNLLRVSVPQNNHCPGGMVYVCMHEINTACCAGVVVKSGWFKAAWLRREQDEQKAKPRLLIFRIGLGVDPSIRTHLGLQDYDPISSIGSLRPVLMVLIS
ncbi:hypothetical protein VNO77_34667 [Canavalia gladiata]|uniref:Uncharacterized protein n=1 Tax=Canavalia gladiata TaxID=3824 RepID=A0AAN9PZD9_CANGL